MKKATKKQIELRVQDMEEKSTSLVWLARKSDENLKIPRVLELVNEIKSKYPNEVEQLSGEYGNFTHGFNSGMMAGMRFVLSMMELGEEFAEENFPELDS